MRILLFVLLCFSSCFAKEQWTKMVLSQNIQKRDLAVAKLRKMGKKGLDALLKTYSKQLKPQVLRMPKKNSTQEKIRYAIDKVAAQKYASFSHLYWHTDLEQAKRIAALENKPILSLHLLGRLDDNFC